MSSFCIASRFGIEKGKEKKRERKRERKRKGERKREREKERKRKRTGGLTENHKARIIGDGNPKP